MQLVKRLSEKPDHHRRQLVQRLLQSPAQIRMQLIKCLNRSPAYLRRQLIKRLSPSPAYIRRQLAPPLIGSPVYLRRRLVKRVIYSQLTPKGGSLSTLLEADGAPESVRGLPEDPDAGNRRCAVARGARNPAGVHTGAGRDDTPVLGSAAKSPEPAGGKSARAAIHN